MKKILIGIIILLLLVIVGGIIFITTQKNEVVPGEQPTITQPVTEAASSAEATSPSKPSSTAASTVIQKTTTQKANGSTSTTAVVTRIPVSAEERQNCLKWQVAHGYAADGICLQEKAYTQEYLNSSTSGPTTYPSKTYTSPAYHLSFKYPDHFVCEEGQGANFLVFQNVPIEASKKFQIKCGNKNLDGTLSTNSPDMIGLVVDSGSSTFRTSFRTNVTENDSVMVGGNKYYKYWVGSNLAYILEKPSYLIVVPNPASYVLPSRIDLTTLRF